MHCPCLYLYPQICITNRRAFFVPNRPSRDRREPVLEVSGEDTQSLESGASGHRARPGQAGKGGGPGAPGGPEARLPIPPPRACARVIAHICIIIRREFCLPRQLSKDMREPFPEALDKTRNVGKAAPAAIEHDTAWLERRASPGADAPLPTSLRLASASRPPASHCVDVYLYPYWPQGWKGSANPPGTAH